jgi:hypothetical protein
MNGNSYVVGHLSNRVRPLRAARSGRMTPTALHKAVHRVTKLDPRPAAVAYVQGAILKGTGDVSVRLVNRRAFGALHKEHIPHAYEL